MDNRKYVDMYSGKEKSGRHVRKQRQRRKEIRLIDKTRGNYASGCFWSETYPEYILPDAVSWRNGFGRSIPAEKAYPKRYGRGKRSRFIKKMCNRSFRKQNAVFCAKSNHYRRCSEFWWELY